MFITFQVSVFRKSPILHAGGNSKIKGRIIGISFRDENKEKVEVPLTMKIQNEGVAFTSEYAASTDEDMEFISQLQDHNDAVLVYINPEGFDEDNIDKYNYTVYVNSKTSPTINEYDFKKVLSAQDWTSFGFKVFVPSGTLKEGNIIISLNVIEGMVYLNFLCTVTTYITYPYSHRQYNTNKNNERFIIYSLSSPLQEFKGEKKDIYSEKY